MPPSPSTALSPAKQKQTGKRTPVASQPATDRGSHKPTFRLPSRASVAPSKAYKPHSARAAEGSRLVRVVEPEDNSSAALTPKSASPPHRQVSGREAASSPAAVGVPASLTVNGTLSDSPTKPVGKAPAFTGDPRNKGLANMMAALGGRRRKAGAA